MRLKRLLSLAIGGACALIPVTATAATLDFAFLPPEVEEQDLCGPRNSDPLSDTSVGTAHDALTNQERIRFLERDIRRFQSDDPERWFDFVNALISRLAQADEDFDDIDATLARIALHIDAGRIAALADNGLITTLLEARDALNNAQKMRVAQYLMNGIGLERDVDLAQELIREAGFAGNANALLFLAKRMLQDDPVAGWDAPADLTVTMAFGGLLGQLDGGVCGRAMRIANEYLSGGIVSRNPEAAFAWFKFAADLGSADAAWRIVEHHLSAGAGEKDGEQLRHYLQRAVDRGITLDASQKAQLNNRDVVGADELARMLGYNHSNDYGRRRPSLAKHLQLSVNIDSEETSEGGPYLQYLREIAQIPSAPGAIFTELAKETFVRQGRWAGEVDALRFLEEALRRGDAEGTILLAKRLVRYRDDPTRRNRAVDLLTRASAAFGAPAALDALDALYRCQAPEAPLLGEAHYWARAYRASADKTVAISAPDLITLDPFNDPWTLAEIQSQALDGRPRSLAGFLQLVQSDPLATVTKQVFWADRADNSDKTMEEFAKLEFELAGTPAERKQAMELFRRVYLNNGVTTALDLAIALVEASGRDAQTVVEIEKILRQSAHRGEGASIRLLARLTGDEPGIFKEFATIIAERGDFLALMFAMPHITDEQQDDYFDRAASLMSCTTKDAAEMGEAHALLDNADQAYRWRRISLSIDGGHVLAKLRLSDRQMQAHDTGAAPSASDVATRAMPDDFDLARAQKLFHLFANPEHDGFAPQKAATQFARIARDESEASLTWAIAQYQNAPDALRNTISAQIDFQSLLLSTAEAGAPEAIGAYALLAMDQATSGSDFQAALDWLRRGAAVGHVDAMAKLGSALIAQPEAQTQDQEAVEWLDKAANAGHSDAAELLRLLRISAR